MFRFEDRERKQYVECKGPGPHITRKGSRWLVVGLHKYVQIEDGTVRCQRCAERTKTWLPKDYGKPIGHDYLSEEERTQLRIGLAAIREAFEKLEARTLNKVNEGSTKPTTRQGKL